MSNLSSIILSEQVSNINFTLPFLEFIKLRTSLTGSLRIFMRTANPLNRITVRDVVVDFFGSLVPGIVFTSIAFVLLTVILFSCVAIIFLLTEHSNFQLNIASASQQLHTLISAFRIESLVFFTLLSYVFGHIFYRQDLKVPDKKSFKRIKKELKRRDECDKQAVEDNKRSAPIRKKFSSWVAKKVRSKWNKKKESERGDDLTEKTVTKLDRWVAKEDKDVEYPYEHLHNFLEKRGLKHLSRMIAWGSDSCTERDKEEGIRRTKYFIGVLKVRLLYHCAEKCGTIIRNEAHVRLSSTTWYLSRVIGKIAVFSIFITCLTLIITVLGYGRIYIKTFPDNLNYFIPFILCALITFMMYRIRVTIENFFHYQRVREIVYVLETAHVTSRLDSKIFEGIFPNEQKESE